jgi:hypothetical protein
VPKNTKNTSLTRGVYGSHHGESVYLLLVEVNVVMLTTIKQWNIFYHSIYCAASAIGTVRIAFTIISLLAQRDDLRHVTTHWQGICLPPRGVEPHLIAPNPNASTGNDNNFPNWPSCPPCDNHPSTCSSCIGRGQGEWEASFCSIGSGCCQS